jgi:mannose-6-phosphate isomerase-like protein (cupin superfamily)
MIYKKFIPFEKVSHQANVQKKVFLRNGDIPHLTQFAMAIFLPEEKVASHVHLDMYETFFVMKGELSISVNDQVLVLGKGESITVEPSEAHSLWNASESELELVYFSSLAKHLEKE